MAAFLYAYVAQSILAPPFTYIYNPGPRKVHFLQFYFFSLRCLECERIMAASRGTPLRQGVLLPVVHIQNIWRDVMEGVHKELNLPEKGFPALPASASDGGYAGARDNS